MLIAIRKTSDDGLKRQVWMVEVSMPPSRGPELVTVATEERDLTFEVESPQTVQTTLVSYHSETRETRRHKYWTRDAHSYLRNVGGRSMRLEDVPHRYVVLALAKQRLQPVAID